MAKLLRQLALLNLAAAVAFLLPVIFWAVAENLTRGTLAFNLEQGETAEQALAKIQASTDIETLRYSAALLTKRRSSAPACISPSVRTCAARDLRGPGRWRDGV